LPPHCENNSFIISALQWDDDEMGKGLRRGFRRGFRKGVEKGISGAQEDSGLRLTTKVTDNCR